MASTGGLNGSDPTRRDSLICFNPICSDKAVRYDCVTEQNFFHSKLLSLSMPNSTRPYVVALTSNDWVIWAWAP